MKLSCQVCSFIWVKYKQLRERASLTASHFLCCEASQRQSATGFLGIEVHIVQMVRSDIWGGKQLVSKERVKFLNYQQQLERWPLCVIIRRWLCALHALHSHHALSWLFKWQRWSICALAISMSKSICLLQLGDLEAHDLLVHAGRRAR